MIGGGTMGGSMKPWLHFTQGENIFFMAWVPTSSGAVFGACIGLFMLALVERWVASMRSIMGAYWYQRMLDVSSTRLMLPPDDTSLSKKVLEEGSEESLPQAIAHPRPNSVSHVRRGYPFILSHEVSRGVLFAFQSALGYSLMLAVMTFHAGYIISIVIGLGVGEVLFGRFASNAHHHA